MSMRVTKGNFYVILLIGNWYSVVKSLDRSRKRRGVFVCVSMPANHKQQAQAAGRCGKCKNCVKYGTKKTCLNPKREQRESLVSAAAAFSSPVTRRRPAGRGSLLLVVVVGGYADGASEHPHPETL